MLYVIMLPAPTTRLQYLLSSFLWEIENKEQTCFDEGNATTQKIHKLIAYYDW